MRIPRHIKNGEWNWLAIIVWIIIITLSITFTVLLINFIMDLSQSNLKD